MNTKLLHAVLPGLRHELLRTIGLRFQRCLSQPIVIALAITERCNARCETCDLWRPQTVTELSTQQWIGFLSRLARWNKRCAINFTGGEPLVRTDFIPILKTANRLGFYTTLITNGMALEEAGCNALIEAGLDYCNFSINSIDPATHDRLKGIPGLHERILTATRFIKTAHPHMRICFSPVITRDNYRSLSAFVPWAIRSGADIIDFIPVLASFGHNVRVDGPVNATTNNPLLQIDDLRRFDQEIDELIRLRTSGLPIVTPVSYLRMMKRYYRDPDTVLAKKCCTLGFRNMHILPNGDVKLCYFFPRIGSIVTEDAQDIWFGKTAQEQRQALLTCKRPCICSAFREYSASEKWMIVKSRLFRGRLL